MTVKLREFLQSIVNEPNDQKQAAAAILLTDCVDICRAKLPEKEAYEVVIDFLCTSLAADGNFSEKENAFMKELFGGDVDLYGLVKTVTDETYEKADSFIDGLDADSKAKFVLLAVYVLSADDNINATEIEYLENLMG